MAEGRSHPLIASQESSDNEGESFDANSLSGVSQTEAVRHAPQMPILWADIGRQRVD